MSGCLAMVRVLLTCLLAVAVKTCYLASVTRQSTFLPTFVLPAFSQKQISVALVRKRTIPTKRAPLGSEVSAKFAQRGCRVVSATDPHGRILSFVDRSRYYFFQAAPPIALTRLNESRSRPITSQKIW
jgi:hypothetical protein